MLKKIRYFYLIFFIIFFSIFFHNVSVYGFVIPGVEFAVSGDGKSVGTIVREEIKSGDLVGSSLSERRSSTTNNLATIKNNAASVFAKMAENNYENKAIVPQYVFNGDIKPNDGCSMVMTNEQISALIDRVASDELGSFTFKTAPSTTSALTDALSQFLSMEYTTYTSQVEVTYRDRNGDGEINSADTEIINKNEVDPETMNYHNSAYTDEQLKKVLTFQWYVSQGTKIFMEDVSKAVKLGLVGGSVGKGFNVGVVYSMTQKSLQDLMETKGEGYDFKSLNGIKATFQYYMSPLLGKIEITETQGAPKTDEEWLQRMEGKEFIQGNQIIIDSSFESFQSGLSEDIINDKGLKITTSIKIPNGVTRVEGVSLGQVPKSVISYTMDIAYPYIFVKSGNYYKLDTNNLRIEPTYKYNIFNDRVYDEDFNEITNRADLGIERTQIFLYYYRKNNSMIGTVLIAQFDECVIDTSEEDHTLYATGRKIGVNNGYSDLLRLDNANSNLMFNTGESGKEGYLPKNVAFLCKPDEISELDINATMTPAYRSQHPDEYKYLPTLSNDEIIDDLKNIEHHNSIEILPDYFKFYVMLYPLKTLNGVTITVEDTPTETTPDVNSPSSVTEKEEHYAFIILRNNRYINDASLLSWLRTDSARSITYVDADTLLAKITGDFTKDLSKLTYEDWLKMQKIKSELDYNKDMWLIRVFNVLSIVLGVFLIIFAILFCLTYWIDVFNTFTDFSILQFISFGNLYPIADESTVPYLMEAKGNTKYVNFKDILIISGIMCALGLLFLNVITIVSFIVYLYNYILMVFGGM